MSYDTDYMYMDGATKDEIRADVRAGHLGGHDYDHANIVSMACEFGAPFLDEVLTGIERLGANVESFAWETDRDHLTAMGLYASQHANIAIVMAKHGVDTSPFWKGGGDLSETDIATLKTISATAKHAKALLAPTPDYMDPPFVALPRLAQSIVGSAMRKDGAARIFDHAKNVVALLEKWGIDKDDSALAWLLGILDVAEDEEDAFLIREEIRHGTRRGMGAPGLSIVDRLTWNPPTKQGETLSLEEFLEKVAAETTNEELRAIAIADSICLVREYLGGDEKRRHYATWRHNAARPLFENLDKVEEKKYPGLFKERIPAEIRSLQEERENWGDELYCRRRGGIPVNPTANETT